jgi:hypothetical protein
MASAAGLVCFLIRVERPRPIKLSHDHDVASLEAGHKLRQLRPIGPDAAHLFLEGRLSAGRLKSLDLGGEILALGADSCVAENGHRRGGRVQLV